MSDAASEEAMSGKIPRFKANINIREQATEDVPPIRQVNEENTVSSTTADDGNKPQVEPENNSGAPSAVGVEKGDGSVFFLEGGEWIAEEGGANKAGRIDEDLNGVDGGEDMCRHLSQFAVSAINEASLQIGGKCKLCRDP